MPNNAVGWFVGGKSLEAVLGTGQQSRIGIAEKSAQISHEIGQAVALPELLASGLHRRQAAGIGAQGLQPGWQGGDGLWRFLHLESGLAPEIGSPWQGQRVREEHGNSAIAQGGGIRVGRRCGAAGPGSTGAPG